MTAPPSVEAIQEELVLVLMDALQLDRADLPVDRPFYEVATSSLAMVDAFNRVGARFGVKPSLREVFDHHNTVQALSRYVHGLVLAAAAAPPAPPPPGGVTPGEGYARVRLNAAQRQLLFLQRLRPEAAGAWSETVAVRLPDPAPADHALQQAFQGLFARHAALRARLARGGEALVVADEVQAALRVDELGALPDPRSALAAALREEVEAPFELERALLRGRLLHLGQGTSVLVLTGHSLIVDRSALHGLVHDLAALAAGEALPPFAAGDTLAEALADHSTHPDRDWWRARFAGGIPTAELPGDRERPAQKTYQGARLVVPMPGLGGGDSFVRFFALASALISRWAASASVVIGTTTSEGPRPRGTCAPRSNALPLRLQVDESLSFEAWTAVVRGELLDAMDHAAWPFARLVADLAPPRDQGRSPIFTVAVDREVWAPPAGWAPLSTPCPFARTDLHLRVVEGAGLSQVQCDYSADLFDAERVRGWMEALRAAWAQVSAAPEAPLSALAGRTPAQEAALVARHRGARAGAAAAAGPDADLLAPVWAQARATPDATALIHKTDRWTYAQLATAAAALSATLRGAGVGPGDRVGVCTRRGPALVQAVLGVLGAGAAFVPLDPDYPATRLAFIADDADLKAIVTEPGLELPATGAARVDVGPPPAPAAAAAALAAPGALPPTPGPDALAYLIYTSGSTGRPKGVEVGHRGAAELVRWALDRFSPEELRGMLFSTSICFDVAMFELFSPLSCGGALILAPNALALPDLADAGITTVSTVPSVLTEALRRAPLPESVRTVVLAGEALPKELVDALHAARPGLRVVNAYGPTEATVYATWAELPPGLEGPPSIGRPLDHTSAYIVDDALRLVEPGAIGELALGGPAVARGYRGRPELTAAAFVDDPWSPGSKMYRTGDLVRLRPDGQIAFLGRRDHQIKLHGYRIELGEIDATLRAQPGVVDAVTVARDDGAGPRLVSYAVGDVDGPALREAAARALPRYMVPAAVVCLPALPRLPNGKLDRAALPAPEARREALSEAGYAPPRMGMEQVLAEIWMELLSLDRVSREDDFFALGGDSLMLGPMMIAVERRVGVRLTLAELFGASTLHALAAHLEHLRQSQADTQRVRRHLPRTGPDVDARFDQLRAHGRLDPAWQLERAPEPQPERLQEVLITGVTGFVGAHAFWELLEQTDARFTCLVRAGSVEAGADRVRQTLEQYGLWSDAYASRFTALPGDLGRDHLGLDPRTFDRIAHETDAIVHMAAQVNFIYPFEALHRINVEGVRQVLRVAMAGRPTPFHYVSTAAIWPMGRHRRFLETDTIDQRVRLNLGYDESKWVAEQLVFEARARGLPASIYRPGEVSGHSRTGRIVLDHFMFAILKGSMQLGGAPRVQGHVDMAPVDYVAGAIAHLVQRPDLLGGTFQLNNPRPGTPDELFKVLEEDYGYAFDLLPMEEWLDFVMTTPDLRGNALFPYTAVLGEFQEENLEFPHYDTALAVAALEPRGVICPPVDRALLHTYLDWFQAVGFLPKPEACRRRR